MKKYAHAIKIFILSALCLFFIFFVFSNAKAQWAGDWGGTFFKLSGNAVSFVNSGWDFIVNSYLNFGSTEGSSGYGLRDNSGRLEFKHDGGSWAEIGSGSGSASWNDLTDIPVGFADDIDDVDDSVSGSELEGVFSSNGLLKRTGSGVYDVIIDNSSNWNTAYGWGDHAGFYDVVGQATSTLSSHTSTYNHGNYDTAYGWGDHSTAGYNLQTYASSTYVWASDWTTIDNYPAACSAGQVVSQIGDTLTCVDVWTEAENTSADYKSFNTLAELNAILPGETVASTTASNLSFVNDAGYLTSVAYTDLTGNPSDVITAGTGLSWSTNTLNAEVQSSDLHDAVTVIGEDYLTLSTQQITANAINPDNLASADFGDFTCNGTNCSLDQTYLTGNETITLSGAITGSGATAITTQIASSSFDYWFDNTSGITGNTSITTLGTIGTGIWNGTAIDFSTYTNATAGTGITFTNDAISTNDSEIVHDNLSGFVANEHIDWTIDQGATNIDPANYTDNNTTYTAGGTLLDLTGTTFSLNEGVMTDTKYCIYEAGTGIVCNSDGGGTILTLNQGNIYVGDVSNNPVATSSLFIDTNEFIGIGTITPAYGLDINKQTRINNSSALDALTIDYSGTESALVINQTNTAATDRIFKINNDMASGVSLYINKTDTDNSQGDIRIDSPAPEIEFVETDQVGNDGKFEFRVNDDQWELNSRNAADTSFEDLMKVAQYEDGGGLAIFGDDGFIANRGTSASSSFNACYNCSSNSPVLGDYISFRSDYVANNDGDAIIEHKTSVGGSSVLLKIDSSAGAITTGVWNATAIDFSDYVNATDGEGISFTDDDIYLDVNELTSTSSALDADEMVIYDSGNANNKKITWENIKATLKAYFDTIYQSVVTAGRSLTFSGATLNIDSEIYTDTKCIWFEDPTDTDDFNSIWMVNGFSATITKIQCESDQTVNLDLQIDDGTPADVNGSDLVCDSTPAEDESMGGDATMADGDRLDLAITSTSGTPTWVSVCFTYTKDD